MKKEVYVVRDGDAWGVRRDFRPAANPIAGDIGNML